MFFQLTAISDITFKEDIGQLKIGAIELKIGTIQLYLSSNELKIPLNLIIPIFNYLKISLIYLKISSNNCPYLQLFIDRYNYLNIC